MPKWLQGMLAPTLLLWLCAASHIAPAMRSEDSLSAAAGYLSQIATALVMALWVSSDARKRQKQLCYDYDTFVFFAWPIVVPIYLFRTRGWRAILTLLCFLGIWLSAAAVEFLIRELLLTK